MTFLVGAITVCLAKWVEMRARRRAAVRGVTELVNMETVLA